MEMNFKPLEIAFFVCGGGGVGKTLKYQQFHMVQCNTFIINLS